MTPARGQALIREWSARFRRDRLAAETVLALRDQAEAIWRHAFDLLQRESPEYRNSVDAAFARESKEHCNTLLRTIVAIAGGRVRPSDADPFAFVRAHAIWRARHQVPLIASLHAYRLAHRTYAEISRDALLRRGETQALLHSLALLSDFWIQFFDLVGTVLTEAHEIEDSVAAARESAGYTVLIDDLVRGAAPRDAEALRIGALCGISAGAPLAVAIARSGHAGNGERADAEIARRSFARLIDQTLPAAVGRLIDRRGSDVTIIACGERDIARQLAQALGQSGFARRAKGHAPRIGVSSSVSAPADIPRAIEEARTALEFANDGKPVMPFGDIDLSEFLVRHADSTAFRLIPSWASRLHPTDADQSRELARTIHTFADCSFNVKKTARRLHIHANTVYFRLNRIKAFTGVDPRTFAGTSLLLTALRLQDVGRDRPPS